MTTLRKSWRTISHTKDIKPLPGHENALFLSLQRKRIGGTFGRGSYKRNIKTRRESRSTSPRISYRSDLRNKSDMKQPGTCILLQKISDIGQSRRRRNSIPVCQRSTNTKTETHNKPTDIINNSVNFYKKNSA